MFSLEKYLDSPLIFFYRLRDASSINKSSLAFFCSLRIEVFYNAILTLFLGGLRRATANWQIRSGVLPGWSQHYWL